MLRLWVLGGRMRWTARLLTLAAFASFTPLTFGQAAPMAPIRSAPADSVLPAEPPTRVPAADTSGGKGAPSTQGSLDSPKSRADTVLVVKHSFNHRQQIITGSVVMTCLALMMVVMNNYNPR